MLSTRLTSNTHGGSNSSANRTDRASPSSSHGSVLRRSVVVFDVLTQCDAIGGHFAVSAEPLRSSADPSRREVVGRMPRGLRQPVAFVAAPTRCAGSTPRRRRAPAAATIAQCVSPRHSRKQFTACQPESTGRRATPCEVRAEEHPAHGGQLVDDRPQPGPSSASGSDVGRVLAEALRARLRRVRATRRRTSCAASTRSNVSRMPSRADRAERRDRRRPVLPPRAARRAPRCNPADRQPERPYRAIAPDPRRSSRRSSVRYRAFRRARCHFRFSM